MKWSKISGVTSYEPVAALYLHERTRKWYVRCERVAATDYLTVKVYAVQSDATNGNGNYSGTASIAVTDRTLRIPLLVGLVSPSLAGAVLYIRIPGTNLSAAIGTAVWQVDQGKKTDRAILWALRALSKITTANGYFTNFARVERGLRTWEDAEKLLPYVGMAAVSYRSEDDTIGGAQVGTVLTTLEIHCVAYDRNVVVGADVLDSDMGFIGHDIRRAFHAAYAEAFAGLVDDGVIVASWRMLAAAPDLGMSWARDKGMFEFVLLVSVDEPGMTEVATG